MKKQFLFFVIMCFVSLSLMAQVSKPPLDFSVYDKWNRLTSTRISENGELVSYEINPGMGDGNLFLKDLAKGEEYVFERGSSAQFSPNSDFLVFMIKVQADTLREAKLKKVKSDDMPKDSLAIFDMKELKKVPKVKNVKVPKEGQSVLAFQLDLKEEKEEKPDSLSAEKEKKKKPKKKIYKGSELTILYPLTGEEFKIENVTEYSFSEKGEWLYAASIDEDSVNSSKIHLFDTGKKELTVLWESEGVTKKLQYDKEARQLVFLHSMDTAKNKTFSLMYLGKGSKMPELLVDTLTQGIPAGYCVSENGSLRFSEDGKRLFIGTAEKPVNEEEKEDSLLKEERVFIDIWHYRDEALQPRQLKGVNREKNKTYMAVVHLKNRKLVQLGEKDGLESFRTTDQGNVNVAMAPDSRPYELNNDIAYESQKDIYITDITNGEDNLIFENVGFSPGLSGFGNYLYWWEAADSSWYTYNIRSKTTVNLTNSLKVGFVVDNHDYPESPGNYGIMGWSKNDEAFYLYDKFDIWKFDPEGKADPENITAGYGRTNGLRFRYNRIDPDEKFIDPGKEYLFSVFNTETKMAGYYQFSLDKPEMKSLVYDKYSFGRPAKALNADKIIWTRSSVEEYPDLWISGLDFENPEKLSRANPQQDDYNWLTVELVEWLDFDGIRHQGLLYKPEDFDPTKKYPMMVYFYRLHSDGLYNHIYPRPSSSTINTAFYASNGYLVFMPDVFFKIGQPGPSSFNSIVSGVLSLGKERSYIDMAHLGIQGQSWGGYQAAYIITQTDLFAAASPGAPVSNMTSAYGGIRSSSGMVRQFQYEKTQSRIGGTLWEKPVEFYENSPLFYAPQCNTPCLIRHNDNDGAVPFSQGVEFFTALRRLGKPAWLLNYNDGPHNLTEKDSNRKDLSVRMKQFFDHYLKETPAPEWMTGGVKAVDKKDNETYYLEFVK